MFIVKLLLFGYHNDPKFSDRLVLANSADPDDQGLHCLLFHLLLFEEIPKCLASFLEF